MKRIVVALLALAEMQCDADTLPPTGQILLYFDTDAPVPSLFDTLRVDVMAPGSTEPCDGCSRTFALDAVRLTALGASIGIPAPVGVSGYQVRARMYPARWQVPCSPPTVPCEASSLVPHPRATVDVQVTLPAVVQDTITPRTLVLRTALVGQATQTIADGPDYFDGLPTQSLVGTWAPALPQPCTGQPRSDEACIPGGAFWMGSPLLDGNADGGYSPHLVSLSSFFMKTAEVTVSEMKQLGIVPDVVNGSSTTLGPACSYGVDDGAPVNCVSWNTAAAVCAKWGGTLATEAQIEYAQSGLVGALFPWGDDNPTCQDAVWGHLSTSNYPTLTETPSSMACPGALITPPGLDSLGNPRLRDRLQVPGGAVVYDLLGSLEELTGDDFEDDTAGSGSSCWDVPGEMHDPVCVSNTGLKVFHGASYFEVARIAASRTAWSPGTVGALFGVRCVRPDD